MSPPPPYGRDWEMGRVWERNVRRWFTDAGYCVIPLHAIDEGGAPVLVSLLRKHVLPDFQVMRGGKTSWIEVKSKHHPVLYQKTGRYRHGVDLPNWWDYLHAQDESGCPGYLGIVQLTDGPDRPVSPRFLLASFEHLRFRAQIQPEPIPTANHGMAYFDADDFERHDIPPDPNGLPPLGPRVIHPWERGRRMGPRQLSFDVDGN
jgi:hypothetical protein